MYHFNSQCSIGNGATAILAGILAQVLEDAFGHIGPFQGAIALTALALVLVLRWEENYGETQEGSHEGTSLYKQFTDGWKLVGSDSKVLRIGLIQAFSEGGMYTVSFNLSNSLLCSQITCHLISLTHVNLFTPKPVIVCLHVGTHTPINEPSWGRSNWLRLLCPHDGYYHGRNSIPTIRALLWH